MNTFAFFHCFSHALKEAYMTFAIRQKSFATASTIYR
nr:MAG TPA: hypothetical protein [Caudoviricetes sp.]